jgi:cytochrome c oxidase subunit 2
MSRRWLAAGVVVPGLAACSGFQTSLGGDGADDADFVRLFMIFMIVCIVMYALVVAALAGALLRRRRELTVETGAHSDSSPLVRSS